MTVNLDVSFGCFDFGDASWAFGNLRMKVFVPFVSAAALIARTNSSLSVTITHRPPGAKHVKRWATNSAVGGYPGKGTGKSSRIIW